MALFPSRSMHPISSERRGGASLLFFSLLFGFLLLLSLSSLAQGGKTFYRGATIIGNTAYYEVADAVHINISNYVNRPNSWSLINFSTKYSTSRDVTVLFANLSSVELERNAGSALVNHTFTNSSGVFNTTINDTIWNAISLSSFDYEGFNVDGRTINNLGPNVNGEYRLRGSCPSGRSCEYSIIFNATIAGTQVFVDFDPAIDGSLKAVFLYNLSAGSIDDSNNTILDRSGNLFNLYNTSTNQV